MPGRQKTRITRLYNAIKHSAIAGVLWSVVVKADRLKGEMLRSSLIGILLSMFVRAGASIYDFIKAKNKNIFEIPKLAMGLLSISYAIAFIAVLIIQPFVEYQGLVFLALSAYSLLGLEALYQLGGVAYHLTKAFLAPKNSIERNHYLQAAISNMNILFISVSLILFMAVPAVSTPVFATLGVLAGLSAIWEMVPFLRRGIKTLLHLNKPDVDMDFEKPPTLSLSNAKRTQADKTEEAKYHASFLHGRAYRKQMVVNYLKSSRSDAALAYLQDEIKSKLTQYEKLPALNAKQQAKQTVIMEAQGILEKGDGLPHEIQALITKSDVKIHQSFFYATGDTIDLLESVQTYLRHKPEILAPLIEAKDISSLTS